MTTRPRGWRRAWLTAALGVTMGLTAGCESTEDKCIKGLDIPSCRKICAERHMEGCNQLARALHLSVKSDAHKDEIRALFEKACLGGSASGCLNRGSLCKASGFHAVGAPPQPGIICARKWYGEACDLGAEEGCTIKATHAPQAP